MPRTAAATSTFTELFRELAPYVWRSLRRLGVAERDADDVCQEVFVIIHRKLETFDQRSSVRTWVYGITIRVASDYRKSARVRREHVTSEPPEALLAPVQQDALELQEARDALDAALGDLDDDKREVFVLFELEELSMSEVAGAVGCPLQTAYSRLYAARSQVESRVRRALMPPGGMS